ncbi:MAG: hypothetical protein AAF485_22265 [Chloroflexota bacterium]
MSVRSKKRSDHDRSRDSDGESPPKSIEEALLFIEAYGKIPSKFVPTRLSKDIYLEWSKNGGYISGKVRNSVRQLIGLLADNTQVPSLRSKLTGNTRIQRGEMALLIQTFLRNWSFAGGKYEPIADLDIERVTKVIVDEIFVPNSLADRKGALLPGTTPADRPSVKGKSMLSPRPARDLILQEFGESDALLTLSQQRTIIQGQSPSESLRGLRGTIDQLWRRDNEDERSRCLIWIVDFGGRNASVDGSFRALFNLEFLAIQFRALKVIQDKSSTERWHWLQKHAAFVIGSVSAKEIDSFYPVRTNKDLKQWISINPGHILPGGAVPGTWLNSKAFAQLYGSGLKGIDDRTFTIFAKMKSSSDEPTPKPRYFGYAGREGTDDVDGLELESPGHDYERATNLVHAAARLRLKLDGADRVLADPEAALADLRDLKFLVLNVDEFIALCSSLQA